MENCHFRRRSSKTQNHYFSISLCPPAFESRLFLQFLQIEAAASINDNKKSSFFHPSFKTPQDTIEMWSHGLCCHVTASFPFMGAQVLLLVSPVPPSEPGCFVFHNIKPRGINNSFCTPRSCSGVGLKF